MFTRYTVPKNYGGSRFSQPSYETETKLHTASNVKTSLSPLFNQENTATPIKEIENPPFFTVDEDLSEDESREDDFDISNGINNTENEDKNNADAEYNDAFSEFKSNALRLFNNIKKDDLMLIALILLLSGEENPTIPLVLSLLLLYK